MKLEATHKVATLVIGLALLWGCSDDPDVDWSKYGDGGTDSDADADSDGDADGDTDGDADGDGDTDGDSDADGDGDTDGDSDADGDGDTDADSDGDADPAGDLAKGLDITAIKIFQSVAITLMENGDEVSNRNAQVVSDKEALLRIYVEPQAGWSSRKVQALVELQSSGTDVAPLDGEQTISAVSDDATITSTINVTIPAKYLVGDLEYRVSLHEVGDVDGSGTSDNASWPASGMATMGAQAAGGPLRIVIIPVRYNADGSGRVPDTSDAQINRFLDAFYANYPIDEVEITVEAPLDWPSAVSANGTGWSQLLTKIQNMRGTLGAHKKEYYYGLFKPANSMLAYCSGGCVAGLSNLAMLPNAAWARASIGLGFTGAEAANTMIHEVGHAHGRQHANCGVSDADPQYPYSNGTLGVWGYNLNTSKLRGPLANKDFMSYCSPTWVSDYTYKALFNRVKAVNNLPLVKPPLGFQRRWLSVSIDFEGETSPGPELTLDMPPQGPARQVTLVDELGIPVQQVEGTFFPYSHLGGGLVVFENPDLPLFTAHLPGRAPVLFH